MENLLSMNNFSTGYLLALFVLISSCNKDFVLQPVALNSNYQSSEPNLYTSINGNTYLSFISSDVETEESKLYFSTLDSDNFKWNKPSLINSSTDWFVNWADFPRITANNSNGLSVHYLQKSGEDTYSYDIKVMNSKDG